jgi:hypothetical protein
LAGISAGVSSPEMADESPRLVQLPCAHCGGPPVVGVELEGGQQINLCYQHYQEHEAMRMQKIQMYQDLADRARDDIADVFGVPRQPRPQRIPAPRVNVNQVNIHGHNLGVVNTGTVGSIANNLSIINAHDAPLAGQLKALTEAILASAALNDDQKREAADLLNEVIEDAAKPPQQRRSRAVMNRIAGGLGQVLSQAANLATLWTAIEPHLR